MAKQATGEVTDIKGKKEATKKKSVAKDAGVKKAIKEKKSKTVVDEIDDIFSGKAKKTAPKEKEDEQKSSKKSKKVSKKEDHKEETDSDNEDEEDQEELSEDQVQKVQEVVFAELAAIKSTKTNTKKRPPPPSTDEDFGDSRGLKKTNRTTEDGYPLYDVKDLNIGNGLDTPECPFDCKCCK
ncbi:hypothetical protein BD560DRAFT_439068 [Blakeslea trispora]|nr:hypothetical protein BD560DRAFT_439068 [Blakeslea trispora]